MKRKINKMTVGKDGTLRVFLSAEPELIEVRVLIGGKEIKNVTQITFDKASAEKVKKHLNKIV